MYIVTEKNENVILGIGKTLETLSNGYPCLDGVSYQKEISLTHSLAEIPAEVIPLKYCYTPEQGFHHNPKFEQPDTGNIFGIPNEMYRAIKDQSIQEVQNELNK